MDPSGRKISISSDRSPERAPNLGPLSPGPMSLSELQTPPKKLQPIEKITKPRRTSRQHAEEKHQGTSEVDSTALNQMRARLDPFYNRPLPSITAHQFSEPNTTDPPISSLVGGDQVSPPGRKSPLKKGPTPPSQETVLQETTEDMPKKRKASKRRVQTVEAPDDEESQRSTSAASVVTEVREVRSRKTSTVEANKGTSSNHQSLTCNVETVTNKASNDPSATVRAQPRAVNPDNSNPPDHSASARPLPVLPLDFEPLSPTLPQSASLQESASQSTHTRQTLGRSGDPKLLVSGEDIVASPPPPESSGDVADNGIALTIGSQPRSTLVARVVYVEKEDGSGFVAKKGDPHLPSDGGSPTWKPSVWSSDITSTRLALSLHKFIQRLILSLHGLLAGLSLWDCVVATVISREGSGHLNLLQQYGSLTLPLHTIHLLILLPLATSMLDRVDILRPSRQCALSFWHRPAQLMLIVAILLVFFSLVITVSLAAVDERIQLYSSQPDLWTDIVTVINTTASGIVSPTGTYILNTHPVSSKLTTWLILTIIRAIFCILSWLIMSWFTKYDHLRDYLCAVDNRCKTPISSELTQK